MQRSTVSGQSHCGSKVRPCHCLASTGTQIWKASSPRGAAMYKNCNLQHSLHVHGIKDLQGGPRRQYFGRCASRRRGAMKTFAIEKRTIPIFPLNTVAFPAAAFPLHIFEARYRVLFNTLLKGADGLEEGLIQDDSPFAGTRRFGMCWSDSKGAIAAIGTTLHIESHTRMDDGRLGIENKGIERFKVLRICEERPVLICEVEVLEEDDDSHPEVVTVADEVRELFRTLIRLHVKKGTIKVGDEEYEPEELRDLGPRDLSYWIASNFREMPQHQQILLQENSTLQRLKDEKAVLEGSVNYLRARLAVESAFTADSSEGSSGSDGPSEGPELTER